MPLLRPHHVAKSLTLFACGVGLCWLTPSRAAAETPPAKPAESRSTEPPLVKVPLNLALISRISVNRLHGRRAHNYVSLGLLSSEPARLTGLQLGLASSGVGGEVVGLQVGGLVGAAGDGVTGIQLGGLISGAGGNLKGAQVAGLISGAGGSIDGLQFALLVSGAGERVNGVQVGGLVSGAGGPVNGLQVSGLVSGASVVNGAQLSLLLNGAGTSRGLQLAGAMNGTGYGRGLQVALGANYAKKELRGVQVGLVNIGGFVHGAQIGLVNVACHVHGAQVGLVNVSSSANGALIGPMSYTSAASKRFDVWGSPTTPLALAWRLGRGSVYSLLAVGTHPFADTPRLSLGAGTGVRLVLSETLAVEPDALLHYLLYDYELSGTSAWLAQLRGKLTFRLHRRLTMFAGLSLNAAASQETEGHELAYGIDGAFTTGNTTVRVWPGLFAGIRL